MLRHRIFAVVPVALACLAATPAARADVYTWVDANGVVTVSNLAPPDGTRVRSVTHETPQAAASRYDAAREAARQAEMQALSDRVRQLESEAEDARRAAVVPPAPAVSYVPIPIMTPVVVPYEAEPAPAPSRGCDPSWYGCWAWGYPSVIVVPSLQPRRFDVGRRNHAFPPRAHTFPPRRPAPQPVRFREP